MSGTGHLQPTRRESVFVGYEATFQVNQLMYLASQKLWSGTEQKGEETITYLFIGDQFPLEQMFLIDTGFDSGRLVFPRIKRIPR